MENLSFTLAEVAAWTSEDSKVAIPAMQRGLVWKPSQVELLWDSILRGFPIGSFLLSDVVGNKGNYYLMDGQQRFNAISLGFNTVEKADSVLWIDLFPPRIEKSTRVFWIKATTMPHPWGFKNDDNSSRLNTAEKRKALDCFELKGNIYNNEFSLKDTWPIEAICPIPLWCLIKASSESEDVNEFYSKIWEIFDGTDYTFKGKVSQIRGSEKDADIKKYTIETLFPAFKALHTYQINCNLLSQSVIENESEMLADKQVNDQTALEVLFTRLNTGGTQISRDDLNYSAIKAYWPSIKEANDSISEGYMPPAKLVMLAFRLALTEDENDGFKNEFSIKQLRSFAQDIEKRDKIENLYKEDTLKKILRRIDQWLEVTNPDESRTPSILRTSIARNSPDIYLLLMYFAYKDLQSPIDLTSSDIKSLAFGLHWFHANNKKKDCINEIFRRCKKGLNTENIQRGISRLMHDCKLLHVCTPLDLQNLFVIKGDKDWHIGDNVPAQTLHFFNRIFWYGNNEAKEMLLYAERKYLNTHFSKYDPAREDLWAEYNRPWDYDHIIPQNRIIGKRGEYREYDKTWLWSIGNIAAISYEKNRSKNDRNDYREYHENQDSLLYDDAIENTSDGITYNQVKSLSFATITYNRFCRIYSEAYEMFKGLFENIVLSETLQKRKNLLIELSEHYRDMNAICHFAAHDNNDYPIEREQDWARDWIGIGIETGDLMVCFEWQGRMENNTPIGAEVGIRKAIHSKINKKNMKLIAGHQEEEPESSPWWYVIETCTKIDSRDIISRMDYYISQIQNRQ